MDQRQGIEKVRELIKDIRTCMLTTMTAEGSHVSRPMAVQQTEFDGDMWFFTYADSPKVGQIAANAQVNVAFSDNSNNSWISVSGYAEHVDNHDKAKELWNPLLKAWFPDELDTPGLTLIKVHADTAEYWDSTSSKALMLLGTIKAAVTGEPAKGGENETINLS